MNNNNYLLFDMDYGYHHIDLDNDSLTLTVLHGEVLDVVALIKNNAKEDEKEGHPKTISKVTREVKTFHSHGITISLS